MRRLLHTAMALAMLALPLAPGTVTAQRIWWEPGLIEHVRFRGLLRVGVGNFEPWVMCDRSGDLIGYEVDLARRLAEDLGVRIEFVRMNWQHIIPALVDGRFDVIVSGMSITPARSLLVNFSEPYSEFGTAIVANIGLTPGFVSAEDFNRANVTFGARRGTTAEALVTREFPEAMLLSFDTDAEVVDAVTSGDVQAVAADQILVARAINEHPNVLHRPFDTLFDQLPQAIAMRRSDGDALNYLDSWVRHYRVNGWLAERWHYWFETREWEGLAASGSAQRGCAASFDETASE